MRSNVVRIFLALIALLWHFNVLAAQGAQTFTLDGRLKQSGSANPILDPAVLLTIQILDPSLKCVLYTETQTVNTATSNGYFNIQVGSDLGSPKRLAGFDPGLPMATIFSNGAPMVAIDAPSETCPASTYTPVTKDTRVFRISVRPSSTGVTDTLADVTLDAVPSAVVAESAETVGGFGPAQLLRVNTTAPNVLSQANLQTIFSTPNFTTLQGLLAGSSTLYARQNTNSTINIPAASAPAGVTAGQVWYDAGVIKYFDGSTTQTISTGSSSAVAAAAGSAAAPSISFSGDPDTGWYSPTANNLAASTGGVERVRIDSSGRLGIGTGSPSEKLSIVSSGAAANISSTAYDNAQYSNQLAMNKARGTSGAPLMVANGDQLGTLLFTGWDGSAFLPTASIGARVEGAPAANDMPTSLIFATTPAGSGGAVERMRIAPNGNVGIGTTNPSSALHVSIPSGGPVATFTNNGVGAYVPGFNTYAPNLNSGQSVYNNTGVGASTNNATGFNFYYAGNGSSSNRADINFYGGTPLMSVRADGNVGVGTTAPARKLEVYGDSIRSSRNGTQNIEISGGDSTGQSITGNSPETSKKGMHFKSVYTVGGAPGGGVGFSFWTGSDTAPTERLTIRENGDVGIGTANPTAVLQLKSGTAAAGTAPLKLTSGPVMTTPEAGAIEYDGTSLFYTDSTNTRRTLGVAGSGITALTGDVTASGTGSVTSTISSGAVTFSKIQNIPTQTLMGRSSASTGSVESISVGDGLQMSSGIIAVDPTLSIQSIAFDNGTVTAPSITFNNDSNTGIYTPSNDSNIVAITTNGTEKMRIDGNGNVGFGTTSLSSTKFRFVSTDYNRPMAIFEDSCLGCSVGPLIYNNTTVNGSSSKIAFGTNLSGSPYEMANISGILLNGGVNSALSFNTMLGGNMTEKMRINDAGFVGIGSTSPSSPLTIGYDSSTVPAINIGTGANVPNYLSMAGGRVMIGYDSAAPSDNGANTGMVSINGGGTKGIEFLVNGTHGSFLSGTKAMTINLLGNVGIGTTSPTALLQLKAGSAAAGTAPLKLTAGPVNSTPEVGAIEFDGASLFYTDNTSTRRTLGVAGSGITALTGEVTATGVGSVAATITSGAVTTAKVADDAVTFAKTQNIATNKILGRSTAGSGDIEELTIGAGLSLSGGTITNSVTDTDTFAALPCGNGFLPYRAAGAWTCIEATALNSNSTVIARDTSGNYAANIGTLNTLKIDNGAMAQVTITTPLAFSSYALRLPADDGNANQVLQTDGSGVLSWADMIVNGSTGLFANGTAATPSVSFTNDPNTGIFSPSNDANVVAISTNGSEKMRIDSSGNVGIGTTNPLALMQIQGATNEVKFGPTTGASGNSEIQLIGKNGGLEKPVRLWSNWDGDLYVRPNTSRGIFLQDGNANTALQVNSSGKVGVGTVATLPALLNVNANTTVQTPNANSNLHMTGADGVSNAFTMDAFGDNFYDSPYITLRKTRGTAAAPTAVALHDILGNLQVSGYEGGYQGAGGISFEANENWTSGAHGSRMILQVIPNGSTSPANRLYISGSGVGLGTSVPALRMLDVAGTMRLQASSLPGSPVLGDIAVDTADSKFKFYNGSTWEVLGSASGSFTNVTSIANSGGNITLAPAVSSGSVLINSGTTSTTYGTGALVVTGGVGVSGDINTNGNVFVGSDLGVTNSIQMGNDSANRHLGFGGWEDTISGDNPSHYLRFRTNSLERMRIDSSGNVGIGTTAPFSKLSIKQNAEAPSGGIYLQRSTNADTWSQYVGNNGRLHFGYASDASGADANADFASRMVIDNAGNVGIGTTAPTVKLDVVGGDMSIRGPDSNYVQQSLATYSSGAAWHSPFLVLNRARGTAAAPTYPLSGDQLGLIGLRNQGNTSGAEIVAFASENQSASTGGTNLNFKTTASGSTSPVDRMVIDSAGSVGVGTTNPTAIFEINKGQNGTPVLLNLSNSQTPAANVGGVIAWGNGGNSSARIKGFWTAVNNGALTFETKQASTMTEAMRIDNAGNVGIGTTAPARLLHVNGPMRIQPAALPTGAAGDIAIDSGDGNKLKYFDGSVWVSIVASGGSSLDSLSDVATPTSNMFFGSGGGNSLTTGYENVGIGGTLGSLTSGNQNISIGNYSTYGLTTQSQNVAVGASAMYGVAGSGNAGVGHNALNNNSGGIGNNNSGFGNSALYGATGNDNVAVGYNALLGSTGNYKVALGTDAGGGNSGDYNILVGNLAGVSMTSAASDNILIGRKTMFTNLSPSTGNQNVIIGHLAASDNVTRSASNNVIVGNRAAEFITSSSNNVILGASAGNTLTTGGSNILIGNNTQAPTATTSNYLNIGNLVYGDLSASRIGIGTTAPAVEMHVHDGAGSTADLKVTNNTTGVTTTDGVTLRSTGSDASLKNYENGFFSFETNSSEAMRIDSTGRIGIGTTAPSEKLEVSGNVKATSFISTSDLRLKKNIERSEGLALINRITGVKWNWKDTDIEDAGVIAQEIERFMPWAVVTDPVTGYKAVKYNALFAPLIEATHQLDRRVSSLEEENAKLKSQIRKLEQERSDFDARLRALESKR